MSEGMYYVKCRECGWEGYTLLRGYGSDGHLYLECENCGARNLYVNPPPKENVIFIGGSIFDDFVYFFVKSGVFVAKNIKVSLENGWTWFKSQTSLRKFLFGGSLMAFFVFLVCMFTFRGYFYHFLAATMGSAFSTLLTVFQGRE